MKRLSIRRVAKEREPFGDYHYEILRGGTPVAHFLVGGGPEPLRLSDAALRFLADRLPPEE